MFGKKISSDANKKTPADASNIRFGDIGNQFKGLDSSQPASWPLAPQLLLFIVVAIAVALAGWFFLLNSVSENLENARNKESELKEIYKDKYAQAVNLDTLEEQRKQVQRHVIQLEKQLPSKAEMDALLSDINQAGLGRGLQFELFKPGSVVLNQHYAELPIDVKVTGKYHDIGLFAADIAELSRIVTLNNIHITPDKAGALSLSTTAKTFRYLDPEEAQENTAANKK